MLTVAKISESISKNICKMSNEDLNDAHHVIMLAIDPAFLGEELHLVQEADSSGFSDEDLLAIEQRIWAEKHRRENLRIYQTWQTKPVLLPKAA